MTKAEMAVNDRRYGQEMANNVRRYSGLIARATGRQIVGATVENGGQ
jgi:hypothetical protein